MMKKITDEEAQRALSTWCDFDGGLCASMGAALEEYEANCEKEEASESQGMSCWTAFNNMQGKNQPQRLCATTSSQS